MRAWAFDRKEGPKISFWLLCISVRTNTDSTHTLSRILLENTFKTGGITQYISKINTKPTCVTTASCQDQWEDYKLQQTESSQW